MESSEPHRLKGKTRFVEIADLEEEEAINVKSESQPLVSKDWRTLHPNLRFQGNCGSFWAFASAAILEAQMLINAKLRDERLTEQQLVDCVSEALSCNGGWVFNALEYIKKNGFATESSYPHASTIIEIMIHPKKMQR